MNTSNLTHYDECKTMTERATMKDRDCDCGVSYDALQKRLIDIEVRYYNLLIQHNNHIAGPLKFS